MLYWYDTQNIFLLLISILIYHYNATAVIVLYLIMAPNNSVIMVQSCIILYPWRQPIYYTSCCDVCMTWCRYTVNNCGLTVDKSIPALTDCLRSSMSSDTLSVYWGSGCCSGWGSSARLSTLSRHQPHSYRLFTAWVNHMFTCLNAWTRVVYQYFVLRCTCTCISVGSQVESFR